MSKGMLVSDNLRSSDYYQVLDIMNRFFPLLLSSWNEYFLQVNEGITRKLNLSLS